MKFLVDVTHRFGSGDLAASMTLNGQRVQAKEWERDSCWDKGYATISLSVLRKVRKVVLKKSAYPGGNFHFEGSGRQYIAQLARETRRSSGGYTPRLGNRGSLKSAILTDSWEWKNHRRDRALEIARQGWLREEVARLKAKSPGSDLAIKGEAIVERVVEHDPRFRGKQARLRVKEVTVARAPYLL